MLMKMWENGTVHSELSRQERHSHSGQVAVMFLKLNTIYAATI